MRIDLGGKRLQLGILAEDFIFIIHMDELLDAHCHLIELLVQHTEFILPSFILEGEGGGREASLFIRKGFDFHHQIIDMDGQQVNQVP